MPALFFVFLLMFGSLAQASETASVVAPPTNSVEQLLVQVDVQPFGTMLLQDLSDADHGAVRKQQGPADLLGYQRARDNMRLARILWWGGFGAMFLGVSVMVSGGLMATVDVENPVYGPGIYAGVFMVLAGVGMTLSGAVLQQVAWLKGFTVIEKLSAGAVTNAMGMASLIMLIGSFAVGAVPSISGLSGLLFIGAYAGAELQNTLTHSAWEQHASGGSFRASLVPTRNGLAVVGRF